MTFPNDLYDLNSTAGLLLRVLLFAVVTIIIAQVIERLLERYLRQASIRLKVNPTKYLVLRRLVVAGVYVTGVIILIYSTPQLQSL
jgi:small conductance mechanosensitive channel